MGPGQHQHVSVVPLSGVGIAKKYHRVYLLRYDGPADEARGLRPGTVLTTSLRRGDAPPDTIEMLAVSGEGAWLVGTPMLALEVNGAGDATAALFLAHLLRGAAMAEALSLTASAVYTVPEETYRTGSKGMRMVAAQEGIAEPPLRFEARRIR